MNLINKVLGSLFPQPPAPAPEPSTGGQVVVVAQAPYVNRAALDATSKRLNMWVTAAGSVGILTGARLDGLAEVTMVRPDGFTQMTIGPNDTAVPHVVVCQFDALKQARIHEIPASRRGDPAALVKLGYQS
ncbi:hypothetical protein [Massilia sp. DD77]|uniref:hypothetical protein n=1 Tax=Massilia sp. DD77 TaxID=3109349 RepID=UPI00300081F4